MLCTMSARPPNTSACSWHSLPGEPEHAVLPLRLYVVIAPRVQLAVHHEEAVVFGVCGSCQT